MSESEHPLTAKRRIFVDEYLIHFNAARAARAAGYSARSARSIGCGLLTMPNVKAAIERGQAARAAQRDLIPNTAMQEGTPRASATIVDYLISGPDGALRLDLEKLALEPPAANLEVTIGASGKPSRLRFFQEMSRNVRK